MKAGICVICRVRLTKEDENGNVQNCPQCKKTYYLKSEIVDLGESARFVHDDIDSELSGIQNIADGGLLISSNQERSVSDLPSSTKPDDYEKTLRKKLGDYVEIRTEQS